MKNEDIVFDRAFELDTVKRKIIEIEEMIENEVSSSARKKQLEDSLDLLKDLKLFLVEKK
jgi:hypothetical protein